MTHKEIKIQNESTERILAEYREVGDSQTLRDWREKIPKFARKAWIRELMQKKLRDNLTYGDPVMDELILKELEGEEAVLFEGLVAARNVSRNDALDVLEQLQGNLTEEALDEKLKEKT